MAISIVTLIVWSFIVLSVIMMSVVLLIVVASVVMLGVIMVCRVSWRPWETSLATTNTFPLQEFSDTPYNFEEFCKVNKQPKARAFKSLFLPCYRYPLFPVRAATSCRFFCGADCFFSRDFCWFLGTGGIKLFFRQHWCFSRTNSSGWLL